VRARSVAALPGGASPGGGSWRSSAGVARRNPRGPCDRVAAAARVAGTEPGHKGRHRARSQQRGDSRSSRRASFPPLSLRIRTPRDETIFFLRRRLANGLTHKCAMASFAAQPWPLRHSNARRRLSWVRAAAAAKQTSRRGKGAAAEARNEHNDRRQHRPSASAARWCCSVAAAHASTSWRKAHRRRRPTTQEAANASAWPAFASPTRIDLFACAARRRR